MVVLQCDAFCKKWIAPVPLSLPTFSSISLETLYQACWVILDLGT